MATNRVFKDGEYDVVDFNLLPLEAQGDVAQIALVERHRATVQVVNAFVSGFGYKGRVAMASTVAHDSHHMIVVGTDRAQMALAANRLAEVGGGVTLWRDGKELALVELPIAGLMSDRPAREVAGDHWVVRGDRGLTYAAEPPPQTRIVAGDWWPADYSGPAQVSFAAEEAQEMGLKLGDTLVVNVLGRDISAKVASLRQVNWRSLGINFVMVFSPNTLRAAPHNLLATITLPEPIAGLVQRR